MLSECQITVFPVVSSIGHTARSKVCQGTEEVFLNLHQEHVEEVPHTTNYKFLLQTDTIGVQHASMAWPSFSPTTLLTPKTDVVADTQHVHPHSSSGPTYTMSEDSNDAMKF